MDLVENFTNKNFLFVLLDNKPTFRFVQSKRGTLLVYYEGNTFTPNDKRLDGKRSYKCSMYYKMACKARLITSVGANNHTILKMTAQHSHPKIYQTDDSINRLFNYK